MSETTINICGYGFVGGSVAYLCKENNINFRIYDVIEKKESKALKIYDKLEEMVNDSENYKKINYYFICVPTPSKQTGECDTTIVESIIENLYKLHKNKTYVLIKSTVQPGTCRDLHQKYGKDDFIIVLVPEFLTERRANLDMYEAKFSMFGTNDGKDPDEVFPLFRMLYKHNKEMEYITRKYEACEIFKYTINCFLGVKVWFFNEINEICEKFDMKYNDVRNLLQLDPRIGMSHTTVPGPDGKYGFSGTCLPKECRGLSYLQNKYNISNNVIEDILKRNIEFRKK
jgi:UDPglucose 6-dehydrogenase